MIILYQIMQKMQDVIHYEYVFILILFFMVFEYSTIMKMQITYSINLSL